METTDKNAAGRQHEISVLRRRLAQLVSAADDCRLNVGALQENEFMFQSVIEASTDAIIVADEDENILIWNPAAEALFGYREEEVIGRNFIRLIVPENYRTARANAYRKAVDNGHLAFKGRVVEAEGLRKDGSLFPLEHTVSMWTVNHHVRFVAILRDVTESRQTRRQLQALNRELEERVAERTSELRSVNQELESFAHIVSHDLKAPLRSIHQLTQWIQTDYSDLMDGEGKKLIHLLTSRVKRMHNLIEGVLENSRIGRIREKRIALNLHKIFREVMDMISIPDHMVVVIEDPLPTVPGEPNRVRALFLNLLDNAIKFNDKSRGRIGIGCTRKADHWVFRVSDNGAGIARRHHEKIFHMFQTLDPREDSDSTGFGLSHVKKIVESNGGRIWLESEEKKGTTFFFTWPAVEQKNEQ